MYLVNKYIIKQRSRARTVVNIGIHKIPIPVRPVPRSQYPCCPAHSQARSAGMRVATRVPSGVDGPPWRFRLRQIQSSGQQRRRALCGVSHAGHRPGPPGRTVTCWFRFVSQRIFVGFGYSFVRTLSLYFAYIKERSGGMEPTKNLCAQIPVSLHEIGRAHV